jgi:Secretion system C-terminal sorting domain
MYNVQYERREIILKYPKNMKKIITFLLVFFAIQAQAQEKYWEEFAPYDTTLYKVVSLSTFKNDLYFTVANSNYSRFLLYRSNHQTATLIMDSPQPITIWKAIKGGDYFYFRINNYLYSTQGTAASCWPVFALQPADQVTTFRYLDYDATSNRTFFTIESSRKFGYIASGGQSSNSLLRAFEVQEGLAYLESEMTSITRFQGALYGHIRGNLMKIMDAQGAYTLSNTMTEEASSFETNAVDTYNMLSFSNKILFSATELIFNYPNNYKNTTLFVYNPAGPFGNKVTPVNTGFTYPTNFKIMDNKFVFTAMIGTMQNIYFMDAGLNPIGLTHNSFSARYTTVINEPIYFKNEVYFTAQSVPQGVFSLYKHALASNSFSQPEEQILPLPPISNDNTTGYYPSRLQIHNNELFFFADSPQDQQVYLSDGTAAGTYTPKTLAAEHVVTNMLFAADEGLVNAGGNLYVQGRVGAFRNINKIYRLKTPTVATENANTIVAKLYPNPATDALFLETAATGQYEIFAMDGRKMLTGDFGTQTQIPIQTLAKGAYTIRLTANTDTKILKFLKL